MHTCEDMFVLNMHSADGVYLDQFQNVFFVATAIERMEALSLSFSNTFMKSVQKLMQHWTPSKPDNIDELKTGQPNIPTN